jgi:hypothetical protein
MASSAMSAAIAATPTTDSVDQTQEGSTEETASMPFLTPETACNVCPKKHHLVQ